MSIAANSHMKIHVAILAVAGLWLVSDIGFAVHTTPEMQLASGALFLAYLSAIVASVVVLARGWRRSGWRAATPLVLCVAVWFAARAATGLAGDLVFARDLPMLEKIVTRPDVQGLAPGSDLTLTLTDSEKTVVWWAAAERTANGTLVVELLNGRGFPLKHSGYLYTSTAQVPLDSRMILHWPYRGSMKFNWSSISD